jgi:hypothetical protein
MEDIEGQPPTWGLLIIRAWHGDEQPLLRLRVVAKADVSAEGGEERRTFGSIDEALAFSRHWLEAFAQARPGAQPAPPDEPAAR